MQRHSHTCTRSHARSHTQWHPESLWCRPGSPGRLWLQQAPPRPSPWGHRPEPQGPGRSSRPGGGAGGCWLLWGLCSSRRLNNLPESPVGTEAGNRIPSGESDFAGNRLRPLKSRSTKHPHVRRETPRDAEVSCPGPTAWLRSGSSLLRTAYRTSSAGPQRPGPTADISPEAPPAGLPGLPTRGPSGGTRGWEEPPAATGPRPPPHPPPPRQPPPLMPPLDTGSLTDPTQVALGAALPRGPETTRPESSQPALVGVPEPPGSRPGKPRSQHSQLGDRLPRVVAHPGKISPPWAHFQSFLNGK
nr:proline-rich protein 2-like [Camelus dromedarius]